MLKVITLGGSREDLLKRSATPFPEVTGETKSLAESMIETMRASGGIGLAGPQVGLGRRIFVTEAPDDITRVFINPEIIQTSPNLVPYEEGCLSLPGMFANIMRSAEVTVTAFNEGGKHFTLEAGGILARVILHEYDHLRGILFVDRLNDGKRENFLKRYRKKMKVQ